MSDEDLNKILSELKELEQKEQGSTTDQGAEVPTGTYEVSIDLMELSKSKKSGARMVKIWYRIVAGPYKRHLIFYNQIVKTGLQIHIMNKHLRSLLEKTDINLEITFKNYEQYDELLKEVAINIANRYEYAIEYGQNEKGYNTFNIVDTFNIGNKQQQ